VKLQGKRVLITGGGSGIGLALARRLADDNEVVIAGRDEARLEQARSHTPSLIARCLDVTSEEDASAAIAWLESEVSGLDVLVNNAGRFRGYAFDSPTTGERTREDVDVNLVAAARMTRLAVPLLGESGGTVVFVSSGVALGAAPGFAVYAATKAAVHSLARSLRAELKPKGIHVVEVLPPVVDTDASRALEVPKLPPSAVADAIAQGLERDRTEIRVGAIRPLAPLARLSPGLVDRLITRALTPPGPP
jgi:uncharacterized oxidoreductase